MKKKLKARKASSEATMPGVRPPRLVLRPTGTRKIRAMMGVLRSPRSGLSSSVVSAIRPKASSMCPAKCGSAERGARRLGLLSTVSHYSAAASPRGGRLGAAKQRAQLIDGGVIHDRQHFVAGFKAHVAAGDHYLAAAQHRGYDALFGQRQLFQGGRQQR